MTQSFAIRERTVLTPTQLNQLARSVLEDALGLVWVEGEMSNFSRASSGHWYFTLKDASAQLRCAMFKSNNFYVRLKPADGGRVLIRGRITLYEARGEYQLVAEHMEAAGAGELHRQFEALKARLAAEGLTDTARKRALPAMPARLALITSPRGAAIADVLAVVARRWPLLRVELYPCQVQGDDAPAQLTEAINRAAASGADVVLLTRGGGAAEDLAAFNQEALARAIAASPIPVVSAIGHEIDITIADFVADVRAPTPSAAAELITPDRERIAARLSTADQALRRRARRAIETGAQRLDALARLMRAHQQDSAVWRQRLLALQQRLTPNRRARERLVDLRQRLLRLAPQRALGEVRHRALRLQQRLQSAAVKTETARLDNERLLARLAATRARIVSLRQRTALAWRAAQVLGPQATLDRGFVLLQRGDGQLLTRAGQIVAGEEVTARFADGERKLRTL